ncbi:hypothetical protein GE115_16350 [Agromyces sp. CFH 90414]|uniref:Ketopantoate reductase C-terminal domain-containing protein n=1 Tax=Agromyces agglutinans TaxID=2662258 RepID=A0A6I2F9V3_9MICO|nr:hypothetical protein [Agromyces agglutinans]
MRITATAASHLGRGAGPADDEARRIAAVLSEAVPVTAIDDFLGAQWTKLVVNMVNAVPAIVGRALGEVVADRGLLAVMTASMRECVRAGIAHDVRFAPLNGLDDAGLRRFARMPLSLGSRLPRSLVRRMGWEHNLGSTQQSIRRGQETEIDFLNGAVVREASAAGLEAPVNRALVDLVHEVERVGFLPDERVRAIPTH